MKKRSTAWFAAIVTTEALLTGCGGNKNEVGSVDEDCEPAHELSTIKEGTLTVVSYDLPPYSMVRGPELTGVDGDILKYDVKIYASGLNMYEDLKAGRLDVGVDSFGSGVYTVKDEFKVEVAGPQEEVAASLKGAQSTFPMTKDNDEMLAALNEVIAEMRENGKMAEILEANGLDASAADTGEPRLIG